MDDNPLVTVVMAFRDPPEFMFREAVESVRAQTWRNLELVLVDDGCANACAALAQEWAAASAGRIRCLTHPGHGSIGTAGARNLGTLAGRGEFVAYIDAGDVWLPHKIERQVETLLAHPAAAMTCGAHRSWHGWTGREDDTRHDRVHRCGTSDATLEAPALALELLRHHGGQAPAAALMRRDLAMKLGGHAPGLPAAAASQTLAWKVALAHPVILTTDIQWKHREASPDARALRQQSAANLALLQWLSLHLRRHRMRDRALWRALHAARMTQRRIILREHLETARRLLRLPTIPRTTAAPLHNGPPERFPA